MRPAFSSIKQAAAFALLLLVLLALPVVLGKNLLPPREQSYAAIGWNSGPYPWNRNQIFEETNDIDILFIGSSHISFGINTPYVQSSLSDELGHPAVVRTISFAGAGYDTLYLITRDLLAHRRVKTLVFYDEATVVRNSQIPMLFRFTDNAELLHGLSFSESALFYFASVVGMPRNLFCIIRPNISFALVSKGRETIDIANGPNPALRLGCISAREGLAANLVSEGAPFESFTPHTSCTPMDACIFGSDKKSFEFLSVSIPAWQMHFIRQFSLLTNKKKIKIVMLDLPGIAEIRSPVIVERTFWPEILPGVTLLGIPPAKLFDTLLDSEVRKLYCDPHHFNQNGQQYFTRLITPALLKLYETSTNH